MRPHQHWAFVLFLTALFGFDPVLGDKHDDEKRLKDTIMRDYKKDALPDNTALTGLGFVNVSIYITPLYIDIVSIFSTLSLIFLSFGILTLLLTVNSRYTFHWSLMQVVFSSGWRRRGYESTLLVLFGEISKPSDVWTLEAKIWLLNVIVFCLFAREWDSLKNCIVTSNFFLFRTDFEPHLTSILVDFNKF